MVREEKQLAGRRKAAAQKMARPAGIQAGDAEFWKQIVRVIRAVDALQHGRL